MTTFTESGQTFTFFLAQTEQAAVQAKKLLDDFRPADPVWLREFRRIRQRFNALGSIAAAAQPQQPYRASYAAWQQALQHCIEALDLVAAITVTTQVNFKRAEELVLSAARFMDVCSATLPPEGPPNGTKPSPRRSGPTALKPLHDTRGRHRKA